MQNESIAEEWLWRVYRTCPHADFLASESDPFRNPVGNTIRNALTSLLNELTLGMNRGRIAELLEPVMQIRAVQDLEPSRALEFLFQLKEILHVHRPAPGNDLLDGRIDEMALIGFDLYVKFRERICEVKTKEARRRAYVLEEKLRPSGRVAWQERGEA